MNVVNVEGLAALGTGTVFSVYFQGHVSGLYRLGEVFRNQDAAAGSLAGQVIDFKYLDLWADAAEALAGRDDVVNPQKLDLGTTWHSWRLHHEKPQNVHFVAYEPMDVRRLCWLLTTSHADLLKEKTDAGPHPPVETA